jgi:hypothetical protein
MHTTPSQSCCMHTWLIAENKYSKYKESVLVPGTVWILVRSIPRSYYIRYIGVVESIIRVYGYHSTYDEASYSKSGLPTPGYGYILYMFMFVYMYMYMYMLHVTCMSFIYYNCTISTVQCTCYVVHLQSTVHVRCTYIHWRRMIMTVS